jgi:hypothetical protein
VTNKLSAAAIILLTQYRQRDDRLAPIGAHWSTADRNPIHNHLLLTRCLTPA